jgi:hypothetical protein
LGRFAASVAYEDAVQRALKETGAPARSLAKSKSIQSAVKELASGLDADFTNFSFERALVHPFVESADRILLYYAEKTGYSEAQRLELQRSVHRHFVTSLKQILAHGKTAEKFRPFTTYAQLGAEQAEVYLALLDHAAYLKREYREEPVLGREKFALADIYVETDVGVLDWKTLAASLK